MPDDHVHPEYLVGIDWLAAHLGDPKLVVLDGGRAAARCE
jgi:hypothetical protein